MSASEMNLVNDLMQFGLNPQEWILTRLKSSHYLLRHKNDEAFLLLGSLRLTRSGPAWRSLEVLTL